MAIDIGRRAFLAVIGGAAAVTWPLAARPQQASIPLIGLLHGGSPGTRANLLAAFHDGLEKTGYVEGQNLAIEYRWADDHPDRLPALALDLVRHQMAVIAAVGGEPCAFAAKAATSSIPIVFIAGDNPAKTGLVASLDRPGGNITGVNMFAVELQAKRLELLHKLIPNASVIGYLADPNFPLAEPMIAEVQTAARALGLQVLLLKVSNESGIDVAFETISRMHAGALLVGAGPFFTARKEQVVALAARYAIPAIHEFRESVVAGGLISYGTSITDAYRNAGIYTARILKGEKPANLPVIQPTKFELVINLKPAKALGLAIPPTLLATADEVIE